MLKHITFILCMIATTVVWSDEATHRAYFGVYADKDDETGTDNQVQFVFIDVSDTLPFFDTVAYGSIDNLYYEGAIGGLAKTLTFEEMPQTSFIYGAMGSKGYKTEHLEHMPNTPQLWAGEYAVSPWIGVRYEPTSTTVKDERAAIEAHLMGNAINLGISIPFRF